jgi:hypothetical protein
MMAIQGEDRGHLEGFNAIFRANPYARVAKKADG